MIRVCLIHTSIIIVKYICFLYLLYLCRYLPLYVMLFYVICFSSSSSFWLWGVACHITNDLCFNIKNIFLKFYWTCFFLIPNVKPFAIGIFYRPPNANDFFDIFLNNFQQIDSKTSENYLLGDFNINLLRNGKLILKQNQSYKLKNSSSASVNQSKELCQTFWLTEIMREPTRITCSTSKLLDHILTDSFENVSQKVGISDHQLIYCTRKIKRMKHNMHNQIQQVPSLKKFGTDIFTNAFFYSFSKLFNFQITMSFRI